MTDIAFDRRFEPVALIQADAGWRAVITIADDVRVEPVISRGIYHVRSFRAGITELFEDEGNRIEGVVRTEDAAGRGFRAAPRTSGHLLPQPERVGPGA